MSARTLQILTRTIIAAAALLLALPQVAAAHTDSPEAKRKRKARGACIAPGLPASKSHAALLKSLNRYRTQFGLNTLRYSKSLELAANEHARDMHARQFFSHVNPDGKRPGQRAVAAGFCHPYGGENIYAALNIKRRADNAM